MQHEIKDGGMRKRGIDVKIKENKQTQNEGIFFSEKRKVMKKRREE